jgi:hypothetical protein
MLGSSIKPETKLNFSTKVPEATNHVNGVISWALNCQKSPDNFLEPKLPKCLSSFFNPQCIITRLYFMTYYVRKNAPFLPLDMRFFLYSLSLTVLEA